MGLLSPHATFTIDDEPLDQSPGQEALGDDGYGPANPTQEEAPAAASLDPDRTRELLLEARDRARGRRHKPSRLSREAGSRWSPPALIIAGALAAATLVGLALGAHLAH